MTESPFAARTGVVLALVAGASLLVGLVGAALVDPAVRSHGSDSFSSSALGHRAFVELLQRAGVPVVVNRTEPALAGLRSGLLVLAEPGVEEDRSKRLEELLQGSGAGAARVLLVLPKRAGTADPEHPGWILEDELLELVDVADVLRAAGVPGEVQRVPEVSRWEAPGFAVAPRLESPQLVTAEALEPLIEGDPGRGRGRGRGGVLLGRVAAASSKGERYVLADPDLIATHGLARAENAALALEIVRALAPPGEPVVVDETVHGFAQVPSLWRELSRFPLVLAVLQAALTAALFVWAGARRFGGPLPSAAALEAGKRGLIDNTAELLVAGGHARAAARSYLALGLEAVARGHHVPPEASPEERRLRLARVEAARAPAVTLEELTAAVEGAPGEGHDAGVAALRAARLVHRWRREMLHGAG